MIGEPFLTATPAAMGVSGEPPGHAAVGRRQNPAAARVHKMQRHFIGAGSRRAQSPMRPRCPEFRSAITATPLPIRLVIPSRMAFLAHHLPKAELAVNHGHDLVLECDFDVLVGEDFSACQPFDIRRNANDAVRIVADKVGFYEIVGNTFRFWSRQPALWNVVATSFFSGAAAILNGLATANLRAGCKKWGQAR